MRRLATMLVSFAYALTVVATTEDPRNPFQGTWYTTIGVLKLEQKGEVVTGSYGPDGRFPIRGTAKGNTVVFEYEEGPTKGDARFLFDESGNAFTGTFQIRNGQHGTWNGWRPDARSLSNQTGNFSGLWLT